MGNSRVMWIQAMTPVHVGCGFGVGAVDLPIVREKVTGWPVLPGSGIKGVLADDAGASKAEERSGLKQAAFGKPDGNEEKPTPANAGALVISDARMVALPVRSLYGTWAWITCPLALRRLGRDLREAGLGGKLEESIPAPAANQILVADATSTKLKLNPNTTAYLADLDVALAGDAKAKAWGDALAKWLYGTPDDHGWAAEFMARFGVVHDDLFGYLAESGLEVATRIRVDPTTGTVAKGQLWTEEALPAETIMASLVWADKVRVSDCDATAEKILDAYCSAPRNLQLGGKATVGRGRVRAVFAGA